MVVPRGSSLRPILATLGASLAALIVAAPAAAELRSGEATDPEGSLPSPGRDIVRVSAQYDDAAGAISATVTTAGAPTEPDTFLGVTFFSLDAAGECATPAAAIGAIYGSSSAAWSFESSNGPAQRTVSGTATTLSAADPALANRSFGCATAAIYELEGSELGEELDHLLSPFRLLAPPPPPTLAPTLELSNPAPLTLKRNTWRKVKVPVANPGTAAAARVTLKIGKAKGVAVKPKSRVLKLKSIAAGKTKRASFRVRLTAKAKATSRLPLTASAASGLKAKATLVLKVRRPKPKGKPGPSGSGSLAGRIFTRLDGTDAMHSAYLRGYAFIDDTWAYNGVPKGGLPHCTQVTGNAKAAGCVRYSYSPRTGAVQVGALTGGKLTRKGFEIDGETYEPMAIPKPGARYQVSQYFQGFSGLCGLIAGCTTWRTDVVLTSNGEFVLSSSSLSTSGGGGVPFVAVGSYPPDQRGSYAIEKGARIRFSFADGHVETKTIALYLDDAGKPDLLKEGFILDDEYFIFAED